LNFIYFTYFLSSPESIIIEYAFHEICASTHYSQLDSPHLSKIHRMIKFVMQESIFSLKFLISQFRTSYLLGLFVNRLVSKEGKENIVTNLDSVDVQQSLRWRNESKVDGVGRNPDGPGSHDGGLEISFELLGVIREGFALGKVEVSKEGASKDGVPNGLIDENLGGDSHRGGSRQLGIQESVKVVTGGSVEEKSEGSQTDGTHNVVWLVTFFDETLSQNISDGESGEGGKTFRQKRLCVQQFVVSCPERCHF